MNIYYIGGSPCAGKSSVAEILLRRYGLNYFKEMIFWIDICRQAHGEDVLSAGKQQA